jgi:hypothetical protein
VGLVETDAINGSNVPVQLSDSLGTFTLIGNNGDYSFIPTTNKNTNTTFSFAYKAKDSKGAISTSIFSIAITPVNDPPQVTGPIDILYLASDSSKTLDLLSNTTDIDLDFISVDDLTKISGDDSGVDSYQKYTRILGINPSSYINILKRDEINSIILSYSVTDNKSAKVPTTVTVNIKGINHAPVVSGNITVNKLTTDTTFDIMLDQFATDFDGDTLSIDPLDFNATGDEVGITRVLASNKVIVKPSQYTLAVGVSSVITYTYYVLDEVSARSNLSTLTITITGA